MRLRDLTKGGFPAWPIGWGGAHPGGVARFPVTGDDGLLREVRTEAPELVDPATMEPRSGLWLKMEFDGREYGQAFYWDGPATGPTPVAVAERLRSKIGARIGDLGEVEVGER